MTNKKKIYLALVFLLVFNSAGFAETYCGMKIRKINTIIVHHSASRDVSAKTINQWHIQRGFDKIGYHFVIREDGTIEKGRPLVEIGAHAKGRNQNSIGICLTGYNQFTSQQISSLRKIIQTLCIDYDITSIERHHEQCPGPGLNVEALQVYIQEKKSIGYATFYKDWSTASGENMYLQPFAKTCASWFYKFNTKLRITNLSNGKSVVVRVNDRGPNKTLMAKKNRIIDLSPSAFGQIAKLKEGAIKVKVERIN